MPACSSPARRLPPSTVRQWPGFQIGTSPRVIRSLPQRPSELHSSSPQYRPALAGSSAACRSSSPASYLSLPTVWAFIAFTTTTPAADFCRTVRVNCSTLSHGSVTCNRPPEVSSIAFHAQPPDLPPVPLMDVGFAIICSLARHRRPQIQFLFIGSRVCSALLSDLASQRRPCASLPLSSIRLGRGLSPPSYRTCSAHKKNGLALSRQPVKSHSKREASMSLEGEAETKFAAE